jgi:16S rRNA (adenine1518-N6/adenine1519-N6)-dimethyltransferase
VLVRGDCLGRGRRLAADVDVALAGEPFRLVANLPYQAATPLLLVLLTRHPECAGAWVTIQKEVADRLQAEPGSKAYGSIGVIARCVARVRRIANLPNDCFWPRPRVTSSMVAIERLDEPLTDDAAHLADFCQKTFAGRRKQLGNLLKSLKIEPDPWPENIPRSGRIEDLTPTAIATLARAARVV